MPMDNSGLQSGYSSLPRPDETGPVGPPRRERADAARNRVRVLEAAARLFADRGVGDVTMDDIAAAAEVGKGTLYRRFGDKGELAAAVLDERGRAFQEEVIAGPPPLGPGAGPVERLAAFVGGYFAFQLDNLELVRLSESSPPGARLRKGSYAFWRQHCAMLLREAATPDPMLRAETLLGVLAAEQLHHWTEVEHRDLEELGRALRGVVTALARP